MLSKSNSAGGGGGGGGRGPRGLSGTGSSHVENYTAINNQTVFPLATRPAMPSRVQMYVNGVLYVYTTDFTVVGSTATWLDTDFVLLAGDTVTFIY